MIRKEKDLKQRRMLFAEEREVLSRESSRCEPIPTPPQLIRDELQLDWVSL